jgi:hypothetical protein
MNGMVYHALERSSFARCHAVVPRTLVEFATRSVDHFDGVHIADIKLIWRKPYNVAILLVELSGLSMIFSTEMNVASPELRHTGPERTWKSPQLVEEDTVYENRSTTAVRHTDIHKMERAYKRVAK